MKAPIKRAVAFFEESEFYLTLTIDNDYAEPVQTFLNNFSPDTYEVGIQKKRRVKRSLSANAYLWVLADQIACHIGSTKEEVYKECVRKAGPMVILTTKKNAVEKLKSAWSGHGMGWFCEVLGDGVEPGMVDMVCYYGSSSYDSSEMARVVDYIVEEAKQCGIETATPKELESMKKEWKKNG